MDINFTGLSNIYGLKVAVAPSKITGTPFKMNEKVYMTLRLKDDAWGKDLSEFRSAIATTDAARKNHPVFPDFLNIAISKLSTYTNNGLSDSDYKIFINSNEPMNVNRQNMKFFTYLAKLLNKINKHPQDKFVVNEDFKNSNELASCLLLDAPADVSRYKDSLFTPNNVKLRSRELLDNLQACMEKYLGD